MSTTTYTIQRREVSRRNEPWMRTDVIWEVLKDGQYVTHCDMKRKAVQFIQFIERREAALAL